MSVLNAAAYVNFMARRNNIAEREINAPTAPSVALAGIGAGNVDDGEHTYGVTFITNLGETQLGTLSTSVTTNAGDGQVSVSNIPISTDARVIGRKLYRTVADGTSHLLLVTINDNTTTTYADNIADASLGATAPSTNNTNATDDHDLYIDNELVVKGTLRTNQAAIITDGMNSTISGAIVLSEAQLLSGFVVCSTTGSSFTIDLPTAANLISYLNLVTDGQVASLTIANIGNANILTVRENGGADANNSINGGVSATIVANTAKTLYVRRTSSTTTACYLLLGSIASANQAVLTDSTGGDTSAVTIADVTGAFNQGILNNNFARIVKLVNQLRNDLVTQGIIKGSN
jgi:hypothetical protein